MINPGLVSLGGGGGRQTGGGGCSLKGEQRRHQRQRWTVMLLRQPQTPSSPSLFAFCFTCQENWLAVGMKKGDQVEQASSSGAMLRQ